MARNKYVQPIWKFDVTYLYNLFLCFRSALAIHSLFAFYINININLLTSLLFSIILDLIKVLKFFSAKDTLRG